MTPRERTCTRCGWVHFGVSRKHAEDEVAKFNAYFDTLTSEQQRGYYGGKKSSVEQYEHCMFCGGPWTAFRDGKAGDCPDGCTLNPIIVEAA